MAKEQNISVLSYLANVKDSPAISYLGPLVAFAAITSSYFGHFLGAHEGLVGDRGHVAPTYFCVVSNSHKAWCTMSSLSINFMPPKILFYIEK